MSTKDRVTKLEGKRHGRQGANTPPPARWEDLAAEVRAAIEDAERRFIEAASIADPVERRRVEDAILAEFGIERCGSNADD
jgi:hypothetical protein